MSIDNKTSKRVLRLPEVLARTGLSRSTIYALIKAGNFAPRISLSKRSTGWLESEIDAWIASRIEASHDIPKKQGGTK